MPELIEEYHEFLEKVKEGSFSEEQIREISRSAGRADPTLDFVEVFFGKKSRFK